MTFIQKPRLRAFTYKSSHDLPLCGKKNGGRNRRHLRRISATVTAATKTAFWFFYTLVSKTRDRDRQRQRQDSSSHASAELRSERSRPIEHAYCDTSQPRGTQTVASLHFGGRGGSIYNASHLLGTGKPGPLRRLWSSFLVARSRFFQTRTRACVTNISPTPAPLESLSRSSKWSVCFKLWLFLPRCKNRPTAPTTTYRAYSTGIYTSTRFAW